jgi:hypothetical protein
LTVAGSFPILQIGRKRTKTCSIDLRVRVVAACEAGAETRAEIAERSPVNESWGRRLLQRRRETGPIATRAPRLRPEVGLGRRRGPVSGDCRRPGWPDAIPAELARTGGGTFSTSAAERSIDKLMQTRKKSRTMPPSETAPIWGPSGTPAVLSSPE